MSKKKKKIKFDDNDGVVYSTNPDFEYASEHEEQETLNPESQRLRILLDRKQRKGKTVTLIEGFIGNDEELKQLEKKLKTACGVGGSSKDGVIIIQGDMRQKVKAFLEQWGYKSR
ncbi:MAG: translation initiation factor [Bacteroidales bacterium]|nr:translation initiation factor [Bacteroidales bacterium]